MSEIPITYGLKIEVKKDFRKISMIKDLPLYVALEALEKAGFEIMWSEYDVLSIEDEETE